MNNIKPGGERYGEREKDNLILVFPTIRSQVFTDFDASSKTTHHINGENLYRATGAGCPLQ